MNLRRRLQLLRAVLAHQTRLADHAERKGCSGIAASVRRRMAAIHGLIADVRRRQEASGSGG